MSFPDPILPSSSFQGRIPAQFPLISCMCMVVAGGGGGGGVCVVHVVNSISKLHRYGRS